MSTARKILWNTIAQIIGKTAIALIGIVIIKMITNYLGKAGYGEYTTAFEFLAFFGIVADLGLYTIGVREMAKDEKKIPMIIGNIMTIRTVVVVLMVIVAGIAGFMVPKYAGTRIPIAIIIAGIATVFNIMTSTISSVLQVHLKMQYNSWASVAGKLVTVGYMAFVIYILFPHTLIPGQATAAQFADTTGNSLYQLIWAGVAGNATMYFICHYYARKFTKIGFRFDMDFMKDVMVKALPYGIALILNTIYFRIGSVLLSFIKGPTEVGLYGVPMRMLEAVGIIPLYFMNAVLPVLTRAIARKDGSHKKIIQYAYDFLVMGSWPIVAGTVVLAYPIVAIVSSPEFLSNLQSGFFGSDTALQILIFALAFSFINSLFGFILVADNRQTKLLIRNAVGAGLTIIIDLILIPYFGIRGAAFTNVLTEAYVAIASYLIAKHYIDFSISFKNTFKSMFAALVMGVVLYFLKDPSYAILQNKNILVLLPLGAVIYVGMLLLTKTITPEMMALVRKPAQPTANDEALEATEFREG